MSFCPFLIGYFLLIHFSVLCVFWVLIHCKMNSWQIYSPVLQTVSTPLLPLLVKIRYVGPGSFFKFCFCLLDCEGHKQIIVVGIVTWNVSPHVLFRQVQIFQSHFRSLIHFGPDRTTGPSLSLWHMGIPLSKHHLLKRLSFLQGVFWYLL